MTKLARKAVKVCMHSRRARQDPPPDRVLQELTAAGAQLVSLNPIRQTLEDFFVQQVTSDAVARTERFS